MKEISQDTPSFITPSFSFDEYKCFDF